MKKFRTIALIVLLLVASVFSAFALAGCGSKETFKFEERDEFGYAVSAASTSISGDIEIPSEYNGKPVFSIDAQGFKDCTKLTSITIPNSVTGIGGSAFVNCYDAVINIPTSVTSIADSAFPRSSSKKFHINYGGTKAQWIEIRGYVLTTQHSEVTCTDGIYTID